MSLVEPKYYDPHAEAVAEAIEGPIGDTWDLFPSKPQIEVQKQLGAEAWRSQLPDPSTRVDLPPPSWQNAPAPRPTTHGKHSGFTPVDAPAYSSGANIPAPTNLSGQP